MPPIPSISSSVNANTANQTLASPRGKEIQSLISQKSKLNEEISAVKADKDLDTKLKAERVQTLRTSIQNIDAQIAELKAQEMQERAERNRPEQQDSKPSSTDSAAAVLDVVLKHSTTYDRLGKLVGLSKKLEGSIDPLKSESKLEHDRLANNPTKDIGRYEMLENAEYTVLQTKRERILDIRSTIHNVDQKIGELVSELKEDNSRLSQANKAVPEISGLEEETDCDKKDTKDSTSKDKSLSGDEKTGDDAGASGAVKSIDVRV